MDCHRFYNIAGELRAKYATSDPFELCRCMGINLRYADIGTLKGMYKYIKKNYFILINNALDSRTARIVCCHELCHHILHRDIVRNMGIWDNMLYDMSGSIEQEANVLSAELMISDDDMQSRDFEGSTASQVAAALGTDVHLVMLKAMSMRQRGYKLNCEFDIEADYLGKL